MSVFDQKKMFYGICLLIASPADGQDRQVPYGFFVSPVRDRTGFS